MIGAELAPLRPGFFGPHHFVAGDTMSNSCGLPPTDAFAAFLGCSIPCLTPADASAVAGANAALDRRDQFAADDIEDFAEILRRCGPWEDAPRGAAEAEVPAETDHKSIHGAVACCSQAVVARWGLSERWQNCALRVLPFAKVRGKPSPAFTRTAPRRRLVTAQLREPSRRPSPSDCAAAT